MEYRIISDSVDFDSLSMPLPLKWYKYVKPVKSQEGVKKLVRMPVELSPEYAAYVDSVLLHQAHKTYNWMMYQVEIMHNAPDAVHQIPKGNILIYPDELVKMSRDSLEAGGHEVPSDSILLGSAHAVVRTYISKCGLTQDTSDSMYFAYRSKSSHIQKMGIDKDVMTKIGLGHIEVDSDDPYFMLSREGNDYVLIYRANSDAPPRNATSKIASIEVVPSGVSETGYALRIYTPSDIIETDLIAFDRVLELDDWKNRISNYNPIIEYLSDNYDVILTPVIDQHDDETPEQRQVRHFATSLQKATYTSGNRVIAQDSPGPQAAIYEFLTVREQAKQKSREAEITAYFEDAEADEAARIAEANGVNNSYSAIENILRGPLADRLG